METRLITNDQQLRRYLPNAFDTVEGETTFFDKILPWLDQAERWVTIQFIGDDFAPELLAMEETEPLRICATLVVVHEAFMRAVPSLDLVLTPNGFGIVNNQNIAPASPHRISRLLGSLETSRDIAIEQLIHNLFLNSTWSASPKRQWFSATLFPNIDLANLCGFTEHRWANYLGLRSKAIEVEQRLAEEYISPEQLAVFRSEVMSAFTDISVATSHHTRVIEQLRQIVVTALQGNQVPIQSLRDIVDLMRKNETSFPHFRNSNTYTLFEPPIFENQKTAGGYWF